MTKKDLEKRIKELEQLVEYQNKLIEVYQSFAPYGLTLPEKPEGDCPMGGWHEYPTVWHGTVPPPCKKCGQPAPSFNPTWTAGADFSGEITNSADPVT